MTLANKRRYHCYKFVLILFTVTVFYMLWHLLFHWDVLTIILTYISIYQYSILQNRYNSVSHVSIENYMLTLPNPESFIFEETTCTHNCDLTLQQLNPPVTCVWVIYEKFYKCWANFYNSCFLHQIGLTEFEDTWTKGKIILEICSLH